MSQIARSKPLWIHHVASLIIILFSSLIGPGCTSSSKTSNQDLAALHLQNGTSLFTNKDYPGALNEFLIAQDLDPQNPLTQNNLAMAYFVRDRLDLALQHIHQALKLNSSYSEARNNLARILIEKKHYRLAVIEAKKVLADLTYPTPARAWNNVALAQFRAAKYQEAKKSSAAALKIDRQDCAAQTILGRSYLELGAIQDAVETLDRATIACKSEGLDEAAYFSAFANYKLGRSSAAIARLEDALRDYPEGQYRREAKSLLEIIK